MENMQIKLENVSKVYDGRTIIYPFHFAIQKGSSIAIVGHNGCGKLTKRKGGRILWHLSPFIIFCKGNLLT